jgi:succinate-semialdehyde dehydrogenase/glutarate-semialdehyde dehydrogenase
MKMFLGGKAVDASDGATIDVINPATNRLVDTVPAATSEDVANAVELAKAAQKKWAAVPVAEKGEIMMQFLLLVERDKEKLAQTLSAETGKPIREARAEIGNIPIAFKAFTERAKHLYGEVLPNGHEAGQEHHVLMTVREPVGVVACVIPFNFPCDLFDQKVAPTLLAGNAAIVKPSTDNPLTLCMLTALLGEAGVTPGAIEVVTGRGSRVGHWLCSNPDVHGITLTGPPKWGWKPTGPRRTISRISPWNWAETTRSSCSRTGRRSGGRGDDLGGMYNCGQVCCASKRFLIHNSRRAEFAKKAVERIKKLKSATRPARIPIWLA